MARLGSSTVPGDPNGLNTASSQFFINTQSNAAAFDPTRDSNGIPISGYSVFGMVVEGLSNVVAIPATEDASGTAITGPAVTKISTVVITGKIDTK